MVAHPAAVLLLDARGVPNMIDVAVGEQEGGNLVATFLEPLGGLLRCIDENAAVAQVKAVRIKDSAGKGVELHR